MPSNAYTPKIHLLKKLLFLLLLDAAPSICWPQTPNRTAPAIRASTHLVVLSVVVADKNGNPVTDLSKEDFKILENGRAEAIATFEGAAQPAPSEGAGKDVVPAVLVKNGVAPRTILLLDELNVEGQDVMFALEKMKQFLRAQPAQLAQTTSIYLLNKRKLELYGAPTRDRDALLALLNKNFIELAPHNLESGGAQGASDRLLASTIALSEIALSNGDKNVRKNVIWIGHGDELLSDLSVSIGDRERFLKWIHYTANWLEETQTTVYMIDPRGLQVVEPTIIGGGNLDAGIFAKPGLAEAELVLESVAPESGGKIMRRRNDLDVAIATAARDGSSAYTLSYYPSDHNWDGKFRSIRIEVSRPGLEARTQRGYYAFADGMEANGEQIDWTLSRAVTSPVPFNNIALTVSGQRVEATAAEKKAKNVAAAARLLLSVDRESLSWAAQENGDQRSELTLVTSEISSSGKVLGYHVREVEFVQQESARTIGDAVQLTVRAEVPAKTDHIRVVLRDATTGRIGTFDLAANALTGANRAAQR